jgi:hypothetical protein
VAPVLGHAHRHHRQLLDLTARRLPLGDQVGLTEHVPARAPGGPVLDDLVDRPRRQQRTALALMLGLRSLRPPERPLPRGGAPGGSALGGREEFRDERPS